MKKRFTTVLMFVTIAFSAFAKPESVQYVFPLDQSQFIARDCEIILRPGQEIDASTLSDDLFILKGEKSGTINGQARIAADNKTVIFTPNSLYQPNDNILVSVQNGLATIDGKSIPAFEFKFTTTALEQPIKARDYMEEFNLSPLPHQQQNALAKTADPLPQDFPTYTVTMNGEPADGDIFFCSTHMIDLQGYQLQVSKTGDLQYYKKFEDGIPFDFTVQQNGLLSYGLLHEFDPLGASGPTTFYMMDSTYAVVDEYQMGNGYIADYHEFLYLPNGHVYMLAYDIQPVNMNAIVPGGHPGALVGGSIIQELDVNKNVIFQWRSWDHYELTDSYNDLQQPIIDAIHVNAIDIDDTDNQLIISALALAEVTKINRQTGDIMWRMGGKNNEFTFINESQEHAPIFFMYQHDVQRMENGNILMFDNGDQNLRKYSRIVEYEIDEAAKTATNIWQYRHKPDIYTNNMGSAQRLENGNTFISWGFATMYPNIPAITEVTPSGDVVFELQFDDALTTNYRARKYEWNGGFPAADVMIAEVQQSNTYDFNTADQQTGISVKINEKGGFGYNEMIVKRFNYGPLKPEFVGAAPFVEPTRIEISDFAIGTINAELRFDVEFFSIKDPESILVFHREFVGEGLFLPIPSTFNPATNKIVTTMTKFGEFILAYPDENAPVYPPLAVYPISGQQVDQTKSINLEWTPVGYISDYSLQVATDADFSNKVVDKEFLYSSVYEFENPQAGQTYYWRVKAYNSLAEESAWSSVETFVAAEPFIKLLIPTGGDQWRKGLEYNLVWQDIISEDVVIELYKGNSFLQLIDTTASSGGYKWDIPLFLDVASDYKIKISSAENPAVSDMSPNGFTITDQETRVENEETTPTAFALAQNYPNPFNPTTRIQYDIPQDAHVTLAIYDIRGVQVATLVNEFQTANRYTVQFTADNAATGVYFYTIKVGNDFMETRKMLLVK